MNENGTENTGRERCEGCLEPLIPGGRITYRNSFKFCSRRCAGMFTGAATHRPDVAGTAAELGVPVYEGIDPSEVTIYTDGSHAGPPRHEYRHGEYVKGYDECRWTVVSVYCPCGHYLRDSHAGRQYHDRSWKRIYCSAGLKIPNVSDAAVPTEQSALVPVTDGGNSRGRDTDESREADDR